MKIIYLITLNYYLVIYKILFGNLYLFDRIRIEIHLIIETSLVDVIIMCLHYPWYFNAYLKKNFGTAVFLFFFLKAYQVTKCAHPKTYVSHRH